MVYIICMSNNAQWKQHKNNPKAGSKLLQWVDCSDLLHAIIMITICGLIPSFLTSHGRLYGSTCHFLFSWLSSSVNLKTIEGFERSLNWNLNASAFSRLEKLSTTYYQMIKLQLHLKLFISRTIPSCGYSSVLQQQTWISTCSLKPVHKMCEHDTIQLDFGPLKGKCGTKFALVCLWYHVR